MNRLASLLRRLSVLLLFAGAAPAFSADPPLAGRWDAVVVVDGLDIPFPFEIEGDGATLRGSFFNGELKTTSTSGKFDVSGLTLNFDQLATKIVASLQDGKLVGEYQRPRGPFPFRAARAEKTKAEGGAAAPSIDGTWVVSAKSNKGETAWRFIARQKGAQVDATILRIDGDTGTLSGSYRDGRFVLSHFSGARPQLLEVSLAADGTLLLKQNQKVDLVGAREATTRAAAIGTPTEASEHTRVKDPSEPFRFSFPDLAGKVVSNTDEKFKGKVVLVNISGSWCPNCHDEAPFLAALYKKYQAKGLEVVTLLFEEADQLKNPTRPRAFIKTYDFRHTVLLAGETANAADILTQAVNFDSFPTTFILGRDGRVRGVHAGFPGPGSGAFYTKATEEITSAVEKLLAEGF